MVPGEAQKMIGNISNLIALKRAEEFRLNQLGTNRLMDKTN